MSPQLASRLALPAALALAALPGAAAQQPAQQTARDEATMTISRNGAAVGRESFRILQSVGSGRLLTSSAQIAYGDRRVTPTLSADATGTVLLYRVEVRAGGQLLERLQATSRPGRLSAMRQTPQGEASKDYVVGAGAVVLDDDVFHHYALLALAHRTGAVTVVVPRLGAQHAAQVTSRGDDNVTVDGRTLPATHWSIELPDGAREYWTDARGRLLKVSMPSRGLVALRDEIPQ